MRPCFNESSPLGKLLFSLMVFLLWPVLLQAGQAGGVPGASDSPSEIILPSPPEEHLSYDIAFLWFDHLAEASLSMAPGDQSGTWKSALEARTLGVAAWLTKERVQRYGSTMDFNGDGHLRSLSYNADIIKTIDGERHSRLKNFLFDYGHKIILRQVIRNGRERPAERLAMPPDAPSDILTAFYNFRRGAFGEIRAGGHYRIPALGRGERSDIIVDIYAEDRRPKDRRFPEGGLLARVKLDPDVFDTGEGILYIWFDDQQRPALVVVEDVVGLGDVRCTLREEEKQS